MFVKRFALLNSGQLFSYNMFELKALVLLGPIFSRFFLHVQMRKKQTKGACSSRISMVTLSISDAQHNNTAIMLSVTYAESQLLFAFMQSKVLLNVVMLSGVMLNVVAPKQMPDFERCEFKRVFSFFFNQQKQYDLPQCYD
jgi:hypothetical protein